jgi:DNA-binding NarL/FixJ family response regulator
MSAKRSPNRSKRGPQETPGSPSTALTERERQIMHLVCEGQSNKKVGRKLNLSESTVKVHLHYIYQKLAIRNRTMLAAAKWHRPEPERLRFKFMAVFIECLKSEGHQPD